MPANIDFYGRDSLFFARNTPVDIGNRLKDADNMLFLSGNSQKMRPKSREKEDNLEKMHDDSLETPGDMQKMGRESRLTPANMQKKRHASCA